MLAGCGSQPAPAPAPATISTAVPAQKPMATASAIPSTPPATQPVFLKFSEKSIRAIQARTKTATVRKGVRAFPPGPLRAVGTDGSVVMLVHVKAMVKTMRELTDADAKANGSASVDQLKADLAHDFKGIGADDVVTVIEFRLGRGPE